MFLGRRSNELELRRTSSRGLSMSIMDDIVVICLCKVSGCCRLICWY